MQYEHKYYYEVTYPNGKTEKFKRLVEIINHFNDFTNHEISMNRVSKQLAERGCLLKKVYKTRIHKRNKEQSERNKSIIMDFVNYGESTYGTMAEIDESDPTVKHYWKLIKTMN